MSPVTANSRFSGFCALAGVSRAHISGHPVPDRESAQRPGTVWMLRCGALRVSVCARGWFLIGQSWGPSLWRFHFRPSV